MKQVVLISGHGYHVDKASGALKDQYDFASMARKYFLSKKNKYGIPVSCTLFNFQGGAIEYSEGSSRFTVSREYGGRKLLGLAKSMYGEIVTDKGEQTLKIGALKKGQKNVLSILDVYDFLKKSASGSIIECGFFSHAYDEGPILANSWDESRSMLTRDPNDKDPRWKDFEKDDLLRTVETDFGSSFDPKGRINIFGCDVERPLRSVLQQVSNLLAKKTAKTSPVTIQNIEGHIQTRIFRAEKLIGLDASRMSEQQGDRKDVDFGDSGDPDIHTVATMKTTINSILYATYLNMQDSYPYKMAALTKVPTFAAVPGVGSEVSEGAAQPMYVPEVHRKVLDVYKNQLKVEFDKFNYASFLLKPTYDEQTR